MNFNEIVNEYPKSFKKARVTPGTLADLEKHYKITETVTKYVNNKKISKTIGEISAEYYANTLTWISFMKDRVTIGCTQAGYIATKLSCKSPDGSTRIVREFCFDYQG